MVDGGGPMSPEVAPRAVALFGDFRPPEKADYHLTPRELCLLKRLTEGHTGKTAAARLCVTSHTVWVHLRKIGDKPQVHSKSEAVAKALRARLVR